MDRKVGALGAALVLLCSLGLVAGCGEDAEIVARQVQDFIQNVGTPGNTAQGALVLGEPPEASGGPAANVDVGSATVLVGGGVSATVTSDEPFARVFVYVDDAEDYFRLDLPEATTTTEVTVGLAQRIPDAAFSLEVSCANADGDVGDAVGTTLAVESEGDSNTQ